MNNDEFSDNDTDNISDENLHEDTSASLLQIA